MLEAIAQGYFCADPTHTLLKRHCLNGVDLLPDLYISTDQVPSDFQRPEALSQQKLVYDRSTTPAQ